MRSAGRARTATTARSLSTASSPPGTATRCWAATRSAPTAKPPCRATRCIACRTGGRSSTAPSTSASCTRGGAGGERAAWLAAFAQVGDDAQPLGVAGEVATAGEDRGDRAQVGQERGDARVFGQAEPFEQAEQGRDSDERARLDAFAERRAGICQRGAGREGRARIQRRGHR